METQFFFLAMFSVLPVISEVCSNPPNETTGEFVEIYNSSTEAVDVAGYSLTDGDALDELLPWSGSFPQGDVTTGTTIIPAGSFGVLLEEDYPQEPWLTFAPGTVILTTGDHSICNGLAASSDPLTLYNSAGTTQNDVVSTYGTPLESDNWLECDDDGLDSIPFDPGEGLSVYRYPLSSPDCEGAWFPAEPTPGQLPEAPPDTFFITIDSLYMNYSDPIPNSSVLLTAIISCFGTVSPDSGNIIFFIDADGDSFPTPEEVLDCISAEYLNPGITDTLTIVFTAPETGWYPAVCSVPGASARIHFSTGGGVNPVITEVMANPINEDTEEFIEIYYPGPGVFPLAGCSFTDGDAVDQIIPSEGSAYIASNQVVLILDPEYGGTLNIPPGTPVFTPANTTLGNGLTTDDPILLYLQGNPCLATLLSTAGTPMLFDDPLMCDDDGLDSIPFNPGEGCSMEKISPQGTDAEYNWMASLPGGSPGIVNENEGFIDLCTDSIQADSEIRAFFSNNGVLQASGFCTLFIDNDGDLIPSPGETIHQQTLTISPGESDTLIVPFSQPDSGLFIIAATIQNMADTTVSNNTKFCQYIPSKPSWPIITEVLCNPSNEDCDEFVEIFFPGPGQADITQFSITDLDAVDYLTAAETPFLTQGCYALILDPEYENGSMPYDFPDDTAIFYPGNTSIGDGLSGSDPVLLLLDSLVVSTYGTPYNETDGIPFDPGTDLSVERIEPNLPDTEESWFSSPNGPTPGTPPAGITDGVDYCITSAISYPPMGGEGTETQLEVKLTCTGTDSVSQGELCIQVSIGGEEILSFSPVPPSLGDTLTMQGNWNAVEEETLISAGLICVQDQEQSNNTASSVWNPAPSLCINEIFSQEPEWIELYNGTEATQTLSSLTLSDPSTRAQLPPGELAPGEYIILTASAQDFLYRFGTVSCAVEELATWPTLNNSGDSLTLADGLQAIDMVPYTSQWGGTVESSLERRSPTIMGFIPDNWGTSISIATPGAANSIGETSTDEFLIVEPRIFNPPGSPLVIRVTLPMQACNVTVKVFDVRGMELEKLYSGIVPGESLVLEWMGEHYPIGRYIVFAEANSGGVVKSDAQVVVLARPL
jgi:hypothetical protein